MAELIARVKAIFRRETVIKQSFETTEEVLSFGDLAISPEFRIVTIKDEEIQLTAMEFDLLLYLARHPGRPFTRDQLAREVWDNVATGHDATISAQLSRLRKKIENDPKDPQYIQTVWGIGYQFAKKKEDS